MELEHDRQRLDGKMLTHSGSSKSDGLVRGCVCAQEVGVRERLPGKQLENRWNGQEIISQGLKENSKKPLHSYSIHLLSLIGSSLLVGQSEVSVNKPSLLPLLRREVISKISQQSRIVQLRASGSTIEHAVDIREMTTLYHDCILLL